MKIETQSVPLAFVLLFTWMILIILGMLSMYWACNGDIPAVYGCANGIAIGWLWHFKVQLALPTAQPTKE